MHIPEELISKVPVKRIINFEPRGNTLEFLTQKVGDTVENAVYLTPVIFWVKLEQNWFNFVLKTICMINLEFLILNWRRPKKIYLWGTEKGIIPHRP